MNYRLENDWLLVEVAAHGAELQRLYHKTLDLDYLWHGDGEFWARRSPVLFPIVGRLQNDCYTFEGQTYHLSQHGFARDRLFTVVEHTSNTLVMKLTSDSETLALYPFEFELYCTYFLNNSTLSVTYDVVNTGQNTMYYSIGAHPAFNTTLQNDTFNDYTVALYGLGEFKRYMLDIPYLTDSVVETVINPHIDLEREWFAIDAVIYETDKQPVSVDLFNKHNHGVRVSFKDVPYVGVWSPYPKEAPFVCIEPWQGIADTTTHTGDLKTKKGINALSPGQKDMFAYEITGF